MRQTWASTHHAILSLVLVLSVLVSWSLVASISARTTWSFSWSHALRTLRSTHAWSSSLLLHQEWHALDEKLEVVLKFFLVSKVGPISSLRVSLTELLETTFVLGGFVLQLTNLF